MLLDIAAILLAAVNVIAGIRRGFVKAVFGTFSILIALILTMATYSAALEAVSSSGIGDFIREKTEVRIFSEQEETDSPLGAALLPMFAKGEENASEQLADTVLSATTAVGLFLFYLILLKLASRLLNLATHLPVLKTFNRAGGALAGIVSACLSLIVFSCIVTALLSTGIGEAVEKQMAASRLMEYICRYNPFL